MKRVGILGLPGSGKSSVFEILMQGAGTGVAGREQVGVVRVPDARVDRLAALYQPRKTTYAQIQFVDTVVAPGSARAAARGTDLFASVRTCDALLLVVRDFENPSAPAPKGVDPHRDLRDLETELVINDLAIAENRIERIEKELRIGKKEGEREHALLLRCREALEAGTPLRGISFEAEQAKILKGFQLLSLKPLLVVYNQSEDRARPPESQAPQMVAVALQALVEREIVALPAAERGAFRTELGVVEDGLSLVIRACYQLLGLISFFTVGPDEVRAWTLRSGERAVDAAAEIHTDLARGFIRAEVVPWDRLLEAGSEARARERAWMRLEGRDYEVKDGDCVEIRFNK